MDVLNLAYEDVGAGPPLVLLHGLFGSASNWRSIARALGASRRVVSVDLRNHGASPWAATMTYPEMAADVAALIDRLELERPAVLGHSMGGKTAMALALAHPDRVASLIVADVAPIRYGDHFSGYIAALRAVAALHATRRDDVRRALLETIPDPRIVDFLMTNLVRVATDGGERFAWRIHVDAIGAALPTIGDWPAALDALAYDGPVTVIDGARSDYVDDACRPRFARLFPHVRFVTIADAGHWVHAEQPAAFVAAVRDALDAR